MKKGKRDEELEEASGEGEAVEEAVADAKVSEGEAWIREIPEEEIQRLRAELEAKTKEARENYDRFLRAAADLDNLRKRAEKEKADIVAYANEKLILEVLPVMDNLERALEHTRGEHNNFESLEQGVTLTIEQMFKVLKQFGLDEVRAIGEKFDPAVHHAISHEDGGDAVPGTVVQEFQKGYTLKGRLVRPSMVSVARDKAKEEEGQAEGA